MAKPDQQSPSRRRRNRPRRAFVKLLDAVDRAIAAAEAARHARDEFLRIVEAEEPESNGK